MSDLSCRRVSSRDMKPDLRTDVDRLFDEALWRPGERRIAFLDEAGADPETRSRVESLLQAHLEATVAAHRAATVPRTLVSLPAPL